MPGFWTNSFRFGLYDLLTPINYDESLRDAFHALNLSPSDRLADFGSGSGRLLIFAKDWLKNGGTLTEFDIDEAGLSAAQSRASKLGVRDRVTFQQVDLCRLTDSSKFEPFDAGIAHFSLYTLPSETQRLAALREMAQAITPNGRLVICVPSEHYRIATIIADARNREDARSDLSSFQRSVRKKLLYPITHKAMMSIEHALDDDTFHRFSREELSALMSSTGWTTEQIDDCYGGCGYRVLATRTMS